MTVSRQVRGAVLAGWAPHSHFLSCSGRSFITVPDSQSFSCSQESTFNSLSRNSNEPAPAWPWNQCRFAEE